MLKLTLPCNDLLWTYSCWYDFNHTFFAFENNKYQLLQQLLQYHVFTDSRPLAHQIVRLSVNYEPLYQLGLDMLYRLKAIRDVILIFLSRGAVLEALKMLSFQSAIFDIPGTKPRDFLVAAASLHKNHFYSVYKYFEDRNFAIRYSGTFDPECQEFVEKFKKLFHTEL